MRKLLLLPAVLAGVLVFQSCSKQSPGVAVAPARTNVINATVALNGSYQLQVENSSNVTISKQASHFQVSQAELDTRTGLAVYKYVPAADYRGADEVILSNTKIVANQDNGCSGNHSSNSGSAVTSYITVKLNIASSQ